MERSVQSPIWLARCSTTYPTRNTSRHTRGHRPLRLPFFFPVYPFVIAVVLSSPTNKGKSILTHSKKKKKACPTLVAESSWAEPRVHQGTQSHQTLSLVFVADYVPCAAGACFRGFNLERLSVNTAIPGTLAYRSALLLLLSLFSSFLAAVSSSPSNYAGQAMRCVT